MLAGIDAAVDLFPGFKLDTVMIRGVNDDELIPLLEFAKARGGEIRFIEYMDVGGATNWSMSQVFSRDDMLKAIARALRCCRTAARRRLGARGSLSAAGRHGVRHHRLNHRAVLPYRAIAAA